MSTPLRYFAALVIGLLLSATASAAPRVDVVIGPAAPKLERFAADELAAQFKKLFDAEVRIADKIPAESQHLILLGSPATNPAIKSLGDAFPKLSDQGHLLRSIKLKDRPALVVSGGSPVATLWAAYELGHHFGVRYFLFGDLYPVTKSELKLDGVDSVLEPSLRMRTWKAIANDEDGWIGTGYFGLDEHQALLRQLAKLKFNRVFIVTDPNDSFVTYEFKGIHKSTATIPMEFSVSGDTSGRGAFRGARSFENPDYAGRETHADRIAAGARLLRGIIECAHNVGMTVALEISPVRFPKEFSELDQNVNLGKYRTLSIRSFTDPGDTVPIQLSKAQIRAYVTTFPSLDAINFSMADWQEGHNRSEAAWKRLDAQTGIGRQVSLKQLIVAARDRAISAWTTKPPMFPGINPDEGESTIQNNVTALDFTRALLADRDLLRLPAERTAMVGITHLDSSLFPYLDKLIPATIATEIPVYFASSASGKRFAETKKMIATIPADRVSCDAGLSLQDPHAGVLPSVPTSALHRLLEELRSRQFRGFSASFDTVGDLDFSAYFLSRASFDVKVSPQTALNELLTPVCGEGVAERVQRAFEMIEQAAALIDENDANFSVPLPSVVASHPVDVEDGAPLPEWVGKARDLYLNAMNEMYRANTRAREGGRAFTLYFARRFEFAAEYMNCLEAVRKAGVAKKKGDHETQVAELEKAIESLHGGLNAMAAVARSSSDRAIIAVLNEYGYRPLKKELEAAEKNAEKGRK